MSKELEQRLRYQAEEIDRLAKAIFIANAGIDSLNRHVVKVTQERDAAIDDLETVRGNLEKHWDAKLENRNVMIRRLEKQRNEAWDTIRQMQEDEFTKPNTSPRVRNPWVPPGSPAEKSPTEQLAAMPDEVRRLGKPKSCPQKLADDDLRSSEVVRAWD